MTKMMRWVQRLRPVSRQDRETIAIMRRVLARDSNCIDIGACAGSLLREMVHRSEGAHIAVEPIPHFAARLRQRFPGVEVHELALSDRAGESTFQHVVSNPAYSGLKRRRYDRPKEEIVEIRVRTERLDTLVPRDRRIHFMKIDVEGAELQVLRGAVETLSRWTPVVVFEHGLGAADWYGTHPAEVFDFFDSAAGMKVSLPRSWLAGESSLSRDAFIDHFQSGSDYYFVAHP